MKSKSKPASGTAAQADSRPRGGAKGRADAMRPHEVVLLDDGQGPPKAVPPNVVVTGGDEVLWVNLLSSDALLLFPRPELFEGKAEHSLVAPSGKSSKALKIRKNAKKGAYPYIAVSQREDGGPDRFIQGNSHPIFIVR